MSRTTRVDWRRIAILLAAASVIAMTVASGSAAAHNPACKHIADGGQPHYDGTGGDQTASQTAFESNKNLGGDAPANAADSCENVDNPENLPSDG